MKETEHSRQGRDARAKSTLRAFIAFAIRTGNACSCCTHDPGYPWCPICKKKTYKTDAYGGCFRCGESLVMKGMTGVTRFFDESEEEWQARLAKHIKENRKP